VLNDISSNFCQAYSLRGPGQKLPRKCSGRHLTRESRGSNVLNKIWAFSGGPYPCGVTQRRSGP
jgi:hypothetical protein